MIIEIINKGTYKNILDGSSEPSRMKKLVISNQVQPPPPPLGGIVGFRQ